MLSEGAKISQSLIREAFSDPVMTMGFEAEFYVTGIDKIIEASARKGTNIEKGEFDSFITKPLKDIVWHDLLRSFYPLGETGVGDNQAVIKDRLKTLYGKIDPNSPIPSTSRMFDRIREKYKPYHIITLLGVYPSEGFSASDSDNNLIKKTIGRRSVALTTSGFKNLDEVEFRMYAKGDEFLHFDAEQDLVSREIAYEMISEALSKHLGASVIVATDPNRVKSLTGGYKRWAITTDDSLLLDNNPNTLGVELISPVFQISEGLGKLFDVMVAIRGFDTLIDGAGALTTERTGLHINIGVNGRDIDYVKLLFLLGDKYVAENWLRLQYHTDDEDAGVYAAQTFQEMIRTASESEGLRKITDRLQSNVSLSSDDIEMIKKLFRNSVPRDKYFSVNLRKLNKGFVEFRSPGNKDYEKRTDLLKETVNRLVVMMYVATKPGVYEKEYRKKIVSVAAKIGKQYYERLAGKPPSGNPTQVETKSYFHLIPVDKLEHVGETGITPSRTPIRVFENSQQLEESFYWLDESHIPDDYSLLRLKLPKNHVIEDEFYPGCVYVGEETIGPEQIDLLDVDL